MINRNIPKRKLGAIEHQKGSGRKALNSPEDPMASPGPPPQAANAKPASEDDKKDFADHLRTVQFTLLIVCLGLVVVTTSPSRRDIVAAHQQILDILEMQRQWDEGWLYAQAATRVSEARSRSTPKDKPNFEGPVTKAIHIVVGEMAKEARDFNVNFSGPSWFLLGPNEQPYAYWKKDSGWKKIAVPRNITEFRTIWDSLQFVTVRTFPRLVEGKAWSGERVLGFPEEHTPTTWKEIAPSPKYNEMALDIGLDRFDKREKLGALYFGLSEGTIPGLATT